MRRSLEEVLALLYADEINIKIETLWDGGYDIAIGGNAISGWQHEWTVNHASEIAPWFWQAYHRHILTLQSSPPEQAA